MAKTHISSSSGRALLLIVLAASLCCFSCGAPAAPLDAVSKNVPDAVFTGFERDEVENGVVVLIAKAQKAEYYAAEARLVLNGLSFQQKSKDGSAVVASGEADVAVYHEDTGNAELSGYVRLYSNSENASFETSSLRYLGASQTLVGGPSDQVIVKVGEKLFLSGRGFFADVRAKTFGFSGGSQGTIWTKSLENSK